MVSATYDRSPQIDRPKPHRRPRPNNLQRSPRAHHLRLPKPRSVKKALRPRSPISNRQDRDGREHRDVSRLSLSPLRKRQRPLPTRTQKLANLPAIKINALNQHAIDASYFPQKENLQGKAVLVETGWSKNWNTPQYFEGHPFLTEDAAKFLADSKVALVGIDSYNIDEVQDLRRPVHSILLKSEIPIVEHMTNLAA